MGLYVKGVLGSFSGKVGTVVGANWRSIDYLRSLPRPSKKPATERQLAQRNKFALVVEFLSPLRDLLNVGFNDKQRQKMTGFNKAVNLLLGKIDGEGPDFTIPYDQVVLSKGLIPSVRASVNTDLGNIQVQWPLGGAISGSKADDVVNLIVYRETTADFYVFQDAVRGDGSYNIPEEELGGGDFHVWVFATTADNIQRSKSNYIGSITI